MPQLSRVSPILTLALSLAMSAAAFADEAATKEAPAPVAAAEAVAPGATLTPSSVVPDAAANGETIFNNQCIGCHGPGGAGMPTPSLFGQRAQYLVHELGNFKEDKRADGLMYFMNGMAKSLSDQDIEDVATYLSKQDPCAIPVAVDPLKGKVEEGKQKAERWVCAGCHVPGSPYFVGDKYAAPFLDGQKTAYLIYELQQFHGKTRVSRFMNDMARGMSEEDIQDIAAFWNSRRKCSQ